MTANKKQIANAAAVASMLLLFSLDVSSAFSTHPSRVISFNAIQHKRDSRIYSQQTDEETTTPAARGRSEEIMDDASDALTSVGWSAPMVDEELTSDDPFVKRINEQIRIESGVDLDELLNPAKVSSADFK